MTGGTERNKETIQRLTEAFEAADQQATRDLLTEDFVAHGMPPGFKDNVDGLLQLAADLKAALSDRTITIEDVVAEGDKVVSRFTDRGRHTGELFGVPPSNRTVTVTGLELYRLTDGKVAEYWGEVNMSDLFGPPGSAGGSSSTSA
ncbi:ester cyclase [Arthrobacter sp. ISL-5]|uniref:ester cyclase n=1 Tax=Arthrobacter sp. ISL-5 TaxID=2819111 RepID=UPI001BE54C29|nr:ester cyclase [Arthrobacter sp. ISL-5]MBT2556104.1 ester cyclase [Arthrobacter sp. ISL-5]